MPCIDIPIEISCHISSDEIVLEVEFSYSPGCPAHYGSLNYPGHPAEAPEIELQKIWWPCTRYNSVTRKVEPQRHEMPIGAIPDAILDEMEIYILEEYDPKEDGL
jgi:hypothetical protein